MKWETKDKITKFLFISFIIVFVGVMLFSYQNCQRSVLEKTLCSICIIDGAVEETVRKVTNEGK